MTPPPGGDNDWFEDYDTDMSDASGHPSDQDSPYQSDSDGSGSGRSSSDDDAGDDGFQERTASEGGADQYKRMYTVIDRQNLRRMQVRRGVRRAAAP